MLFIGCLPLKGGIPCVDFSDWVRSPPEDVARKLRVPHVAAVEFGKGYAAVHTEFALRGWPDDVDAFYIDSMGPSKACLETLIQQADVVIHKM